MGKPTAKLSRVLVCVLHCFLICSSSDIQESVDSRLHGVCPLISKLERLFCKSSILVDHLIDQVLHRPNIDWSTQLSMSVKIRDRYILRTSRMLFSIKLLAPPRASKIGLTEFTKCFSMITWLMLCSVVLMLGLVGMMISWNVSKRWCQSRALPHSSQDPVGIDKFLQS